ncbi:MULTISPECIES: hypothetical protein [Dyella]|nr:MULTISPECIES: hypothetical protein [Dyella]
MSGNASAYGLRVTPLTGSVDDGNPLLDYFVGNLAPDQRTQAQLVTRTYE